MKLKTLLKQVPLKLYRGSKEVEITGLCLHSKRVAPGNLFIAKKGTATDGAKFIDEAVTSGAAAILAEAGDPFLKNVVQLTHPDIRSVLGKLAAAFYGRPAEELFVVGVTGTCGKTTTTYIIRYLLEKLGKPTGLIGSIESIIQEQHYPSSLTTPDVITCHKLLKEMVSKKCQAVVMEATSIGLDQGRVDEVSFDVAIFTNLSRDHLDYHPSMEEYAKAKQKFFRGLRKEAFAIINNDSPYSKLMQEGCAAPIITYGLTEGADLYATSISLSPSGTTFDLTYKGVTKSCSMPLVGRHNVENVLAALATLLTQNVPFHTFPELISKLPPVRGRLEKVEGMPVFVDHAHKPDALENVLKTLMEVKKGRIITVFGCGGDRDRGKRPLMARIAENYSDLVFVTSDNPRSEDPAAIIDDVVKGFAKKDYLIEVDRRAAIHKAIRSARPEDLILIAGKGHETYQVFSNQTLPFDDRLVAAELR